MTCVLEVRRARIIPEPISEPLPCERSPASTNARVVVTAVIVAVADVAPPVSEVVPRCTLIFDESSNDTTCHQIVCPELAVFARNCRFVVEVRSPSRKSSSAKLASELTGVFDHVTNA